MPAACRKAAFRWQLVASRKTAGLPKVGRVPVAPPNKEGHPNVAFFIYDIIT